jgi:[ribosomal protein S18]-alanine N-acetyltransferase
VFGHIGERIMVESVSRLSGDPLEFRILRPELSSFLSGFFSELLHGPGHEYFHPHPMTGEEAERLCSYSGRDLYYVACTGTAIIAYGMLRGWDEGFAIPSLGIAVHPNSRGRGLSRPFMEFLHMAAKFHGAEKVRLTVYAENSRAVELYRRLGYRFEKKNDQELIGLLEL